MAPLTSADLNLLVFRYLAESGFRHSAFTFGYEAGVHKNPTDGSMVPPSALITLVQKGLQYMELEANCANDDDNLDEDFSLLKPLELISKSADELWQIMNERKRKLQEENDKNIGKENDAEGKLSKVRDLRKMGKGKEQDMQCDSRDEMDVAVSSPRAHNINSSDVVKLEGHTGEVYACAWSPAGSILASGSEDATARIWSIGNVNDKSRTHSKLSNVLVLKHGNEQSKETSHDVTTIDWNGQGTLLATGSYDGLAKIWTADGELKSILNKHRGPISSVKWNKRGDYILTAGADGSAIVWDVKAVTCKQQFSFHSGPALDVDWRNNTVFATCSSDQMVYVCKVGEPQAIKSFAGHKSVVNCIKWDPSGQFLASCSDDSTAKVWSSEKHRYLHDFREHAQEVYTIKWSPTGQGSTNPNLRPLLASASFDSTVKLWDIEQGRCLYTLKGHRGKVYAIAFSPNGEYLASGALVNTVLVWSVRESKIVKVYPDLGGIYDICWNKDGDKIAASFGNHSVQVMNFRM